jgi:hypothetical protein
VLSIAAGFLYFIIVLATMMTFAYYMPIWFQVVQWVSAVRSGIMVLPMVVSIAMA